MRTPSLAALALLLGSALAGCPGTSTPGAGECEVPADCGDAEAPCAGCPPLATSLCVEGACLAREDDAVDVSADVNIHRDVAPSVRSFVHALIDVSGASGKLSCANVLDGGQVTAGANVLAAGYKSVSGGSFHDDVSLGRVPEGEMLLVIIATSANAGGGDVLATGCVEGLKAEAPSLDAGLVQVTP